MKKTPRTGLLNLERTRILNSILFWICLSLLVLVPLVFAVSVYRTYATPKLAILLVGASILAPLAVLAALAAARNGFEMARLFNPAHFVLVTLYFASVTVSTFFGVEPIASLFGYFHNQMGLVPQLCFFAFFIALIFGINNDENRLDKTLWVMAVTGFLVSVYSVIQFFGYDPFLKASLYTYKSQEGNIRRVIGTLGHADYLGNFLMYTAPICVALGVASRGRARLLAAIMSCASVAAIAMSGTRGAWAGIIAAAVAVCFLEVKTGKKIWQAMPRGMLVRRVLVSLVIVVAIAGAMSLSPAARGVAVRARSLATEGFSGAGRSLLWRDSIRMIPSFALVGSGPDSFRMAFLAYRSTELARLTDSSNESSHNSYLDAAISYGIPGGLLYIAVIASAFRLLLLARRRAVSSHLKAVVTGLFASLVAAATHNFFIFNQLPTGLYFFGLIAMAQVVTNLSEVREGSAAVRAPTKSNSQRTTGTHWTATFSSPIFWATAISGCALVAAAVWYSSGILREDLAINKTLQAAERGDLDRVIEHGLRATSGPEATGDSALMVASAAGICASRLQESVNNARKSGRDPQQMVQALERARELGATYAQKSLEHTFTPDLSYLFLASYAQARGDMLKMREYTMEVIRRDPNNKPAHQMLAQAYLATGENVLAAREAELALDLDPLSLETATILARARGEDTTDDSAALRIVSRMRNSSPNLKRTVEDLVEAGRRLSQAGELRKAQIKLVTAIERAAGPCPDCHYELAIVYEKMARYADALAEWRTLVEQDPKRASAEQIEMRLETLKQKSGTPK